LPSSITVIGTTLKKGTLPNITMGRDLLLGIKGFAVNDLISGLKKALSTFKEVLDEKTFER
jgi:hypothetical protein